MQHFHPPGQTYSSWVKQFAIEKHDAPKTELYSVVTKPIIKLVI